MTTRFEEQHLNADDLVRAAAGQWKRDGERVQLLVHLGGDCPTCTAELHKVAEHSELAAPLPGDPVAAALGRRLGSVDDTTHVRPVTWHWIRRLREDGWAFCRLVLEEIRDQVLRPLEEEEDTGPLLAMTSDAVDLFADPAFYVLGERRWHDLQALACLYQAVAFRRAGKHEKASDEVQRAERHIVLGSEDLEVRAAYHLHWHETLPGRGFRLLQRLERVEKVEKVLADAKPYRRLAEHHAELFAMKGATLRREAGTRAGIREVQEVYAQALLHTPKECPAWRQGVVVRLLDESMALSDFETARGHLALAEELTALYGGDDDRVCVGEIREALAFLSIGEEVAACRI